MMTNHETTLGHLVLLSDPESSPERGRQAIEDLGEIADDLAIVYLGYQVAPGSPFSREAAAALQTIGPKAKALFQRILSNPEPPASHVEVLAWVCEQPEMRDEMALTVSHLVRVGAAYGLGAFEPLDDDSIDSLIDALRVLEPDDDEGYAIDVAAQVLSAHRVERAGPALLKLYDALVSRDLPVPNIWPLLSTLAMSFGRLRLPGAVPRLLHFLHSVGRDYEFWELGDDALFEIVVSHRGDFAEFGLGAEHAPIIAELRADTPTDDDGFLEVLDELSTGLEKATT